MKYTTNAIGVSGVAERAGERVGVGVRACIGRRGFGGKREEGRGGVRDGTRFGEGDEGGGVAETGVGVGVREGVGVSESEGVGEALEAEEEGREEEISRNFRS